MNDTSADDVADVSTEQPVAGDANDGAHAGSTSAEDPAPMRVIRAPDVVAEQVRPMWSRRSVRVVKRRVFTSLDDIQQTVDEAQRCLDEAVEEADEIRREARKGGRAAGFNEVVDQLSAARREYDAIVDEARCDMVEMAFRLAERLVGEAIEVEPARLDKMVAEVIQHARGRRDIVVAAAPGDLDRLEGCADEFSRQLDGGTVRFEADPDLERGSCVVHTETGRVDGRIKTRLETLQRALQDG